ncbi:MAG TPA: glycosyltransferase [Planctomycetota bacterium]|jgi:GT2 family glycosyltransferase
MTAQLAPPNFLSTFGHADVSLVEIEPGTDVHTWTATGHQPYFLITRPLPAGIAHLRLKLTSDTRGRGSLSFDTGSGFSETGSIALPELRRELEIDTHIRLEKPVRAIRYCPLDKPGTFTLEHFSLEHISVTKTYARAIRAKLKEIRENNKLGRAAKKGLKLLLSGDFASFKKKLVQSLGGGVDTRAADYRLWRETNQMTDARRARIRAEIADMSSPPLLSVLMPVYNAPELYLRMAIDSVLRQLYPHWELCIADDCSTAAHVRPLLAEYAARDPRIRVTYREKNGNISAATNTALEMARGDFIALMDNDDELAEHALFKFAQAIAADRSLDMLYSDEDKIDIHGQHSDPFFKPDWSPEYFLACMYTCHLGVYRTALVREIGGFRSAFDTAQDYDMVLRLTAKTSRIHHIPDILYHWRMLPTSTASGASAKPKAHVTSERALQEFIRATGRTGTVEDGPALGFHRVRYAISGEPLVSIIIPSACKLVKIRERDSYYALECIKSVVAKTTWKHYEILLLVRDDIAVGSGSVPPSPPRGGAGGGVPPPLQSQLEEMGVRRISYSEPFNWSRVNNLGATHAKGSHLLFLNDDMELISPDWLQALLEFSQVPEIGAVGGRLLFPDDRLQHGGVNVLDGNPGHPFYGCEAGRNDYFYNTIVHRNCAAVTGACLMTRADVFKSVGGFAEKFHLNYNDVDYCLRVIESGKRIVYTPYAELYHYESVSKAGVGQDELAAFKSVWAKKWPRDPYYNPNLTTQGCDYRIDTDHLA